MAAARLAPAIVVELAKVDHLLVRYGYADTCELLAQRKRPLLRSSLGATQLGRLVATIGAWPVIGRSCLRRALVLSDLLRRSGHNPCVRIGARHNVERRIEAHAWVEVAGAVIGERGNVDGFAVLRGLQPV